MDRAPGMSVRLKLTLSYAAFVMLAGALLLGVVWVFLLRYVPRHETVIVHHAQVFFSPGRGALLRDFAPAAAISGAFLVVFGLLGGWFLAGRMLAPLGRITEATRIAANGSLSHRIRLPGRRDEFRELADAFDAMLAQLEAQVAEQQRFAANASHELRTPMAITQTLLQVARNDPDRDSDELVERLDAVNARAIDVTEALLLLSQADRRSFSPECVDLSLVAEEANETLLAFAEQPRHHHRDIRRQDPLPRVARTAAADGDEPRPQRDRPQPADQGTVWLTTSAEPDTVVLAVENTGEELTPELVSTLAEPFQRGTERIRSDHAGIGLGLAIVTTIAHAHDGSLTLTPRAGGGLCATVRLPAPTARSGA